MTRASAIAAVQLGILRFPVHGRLFRSRRGAPDTPVIVDVLGALANLALLATSCASVRHVLSDGSIAFDSPDGCRRMDLPAVTRKSRRRFSVQLPTVAVRLDPQAMAVPQ